MKPGSLVTIDESNWRRTLQVRVTDDQLAFAADYQPVALVILAKAYVQPGGQVWEPLAYLAEDGEIAAVLALAHRGAVSELVNLAVDRHRQGQGIGAAVMAAVIDRLRTRGSAALELTVHPRNEPAVRLYHRTGLRTTGETRNGEPVWRLPLGQ